MKDRLTLLLYKIGWLLPYKVVDGRCIFSWPSRVTWWLILKIDPEFSDGG